MRKVSVAVFVAAKIGSNEGAVDVLQCTVKSKSIQQRPEMESVAEKDTGKVGSYVKAGHLIFELATDPYYGGHSWQTDRLIADIHERFPGDDRLAAFSRRFSMHPMAKEHETHLVRLWIVALELPVYQGGTPLTRSAEEFVRQWTDDDYEIELGELEVLLRSNKWPLPAIFYPAELDNTASWLELTEKEQEEAGRVVWEIIPGLEAEKERLKAITPATLADHDAIRERIQNIDQEIAAFYRGERPRENVETAAQRRERLLLWYEEEKLNRGVWGAFARTAKREGVGSETVRRLIHRAKDERGEKD